MMRQAQGTNNQAMSFGKSRARMFLGNKTVVTFNDVAGVDEAKQELTEVVEFLKYPEKFNSPRRAHPARRAAGRPARHRQDAPRARRRRRGGRAVLLASPAPSSSRCSSASARRRVRDLFEQAKRNSPCIVFVDEIDAVGRQRGAGLGGSHDEREQTLNQILVEMDGFDTNTNVIVVAATNRPDVLDPALLRPGRFDRQVVLDRPDIKGRKRDPQRPHQGQAARQDRRHRGARAALAGLLRRRPREPRQRGGHPRRAPQQEEHRRRSEFNEAIDRVIAGPERRSRIITEEEKEIIAYHEGGHAVVQRVLPEVRPGHEGDDRVARHGPRLHDEPARRRTDTSTRKTEFEDKIAGMLGGNVAETLVFGDTTTGSSNDIEKATNLARAMVTQYGMSEKLGPLAFGKKEEMVFLGREISEQRNYSRRGRGEDRRRGARDHRPRL